MPFVNVGLAIKSNRSRKSKSPVRYYIGKSRTYAKVIITQEVVDKCKFTDLYCRILFDPKELRMRVEACADQYEIGSYKWHATSSGAFLQFAIPPKEICPLPESEYSISTFNAISKVLDFTFLNVDIVKKAAA